MEFFQKGKVPTANPLGVVKVDAPAKDSVSHKANHKVSPKVNHKTSQNTKKDGRKVKKKSINTKDKIETLYALRNAMKL